MIAGLNETSFSFVGFDNLNTTTEAFKSELVFFNTLSDEFDAIRNKDFNGKKDKPLLSTKAFAKEYKDKKILAYNT